MTDKVKYWLDLAKEDITVAKVLLDGNKLLYCGFMCHLAVEKALKAKVESVGTTPPTIHKLIRLAELGGILDDLSEDQNNLLDILNPLQIEARYPTYKQQVVNALSMGQCTRLIQQSKELISWIEKKL